MRTLARYATTIAMLFTFIWIFFNLPMSIMHAIQGLMAAEAGREIAIDYFAIAIIQALTALFAAWLRGHLNRWRLRLSA